MSIEAERIDTDEVLKMEKEKRESGPGNVLASSPTVDHPAHYNTGEIEVIDAIEDWSLGFHEGNVVKYVARARHKGRELEDLKKARWYLDRAIANLEGSQ